LLKLLNEYCKKTSSIIAENIINNYKEEIKNFMIVKPKASSYKELLTLITKVA
jgi:glutamate synthase domain-containing protein 3